ncbi:hypothetical protein INR49_004934 [Caranx melampygus]|nr:hypothetical protein INR49_004934 [Caranx melampygus]
MEEMNDHSVCERVVVQSGVPVVVVHHATAAPLSKEETTGVVIRVVQHQTFFQVLFGVLTHLVRTEKEVDYSTHTQQQALVLLDGTQAAQEARHHDNDAEGDDEVGSGERREGGRQGGKAALRDRQPHADTQQPAPTQLRTHTGNSRTSCPSNDNEGL